MDRFGRFRIVVAVAVVVGHQIVGSVAVAVAAVVVGHQIAIAAIAALAGPACPAPPYSCNIPNLCRRIRTWSSIRH